jgi:uncharacterized protein (DUF736 family)
MDDKDRGVLFTETEKKSDKAPDFKGKFNYNGAEFKIAGWKRTSAKGLEYISLSVDNYEPSDQPSSGYDKFRQAGEKIKEDIIADVPDGEIDLSEIPF